MNARAVIGIVAAMVALLVSACTTSGVVPFGPDTYMITKSEWGFSGTAPLKAEAIKEAAAYCEGHGKVLKVTKTVENSLKVGSTPSVEVYFKALNPSDPELKQPATIEEIVR